MIVTTQDVRERVEALFRIERAKLIGGLARRVGDVGLAEDLAQEALIAALTTWPRTGVPGSPGAWLMATAKHRAVSDYRRVAMIARKSVLIEPDLREAGEDPALALDAALDDELSDEVLGLIFVACHPILPPEQAAALTLRLVAGLTTSEIARAFVVSEGAVAQRIVRAKRTLSAARVGFEIPVGEERARRLGAVLEIVYLIFSEGYFATSGEAVTRPILCREAQRLGRIVAGLAPLEPQVLGLLALMEIQASRLPTRVTASGEPIPLPEQDRTQWDRLLIQRGLTALSQAWTLGGQNDPYVLQAAIAACHARARTSEETDWRRIARLYDVLAEVSPSPIVSLNQAVAHSMAYGPEVGLAMIDELSSAPLLQAYALLPAARGDCLFRCGRFAEAKFEFLRAADLSSNERQRTFLLARSSECEDFADPTC